MAEILKSRICSLKMDDGEVLDVHKWVMLNYTDDGSISVRIDYEAMRNDGYCLERQENTLAYRLRTANIGMQNAFNAMDMQRWQAMQYQGQRASPFSGVFGGLLG